MSKTITLRIPDDLDFCLTRVIQEIEFKHSNIKIPKTGAIIAGIEAWISNEIGCTYQTYLTEIAPTTYGKKYMTKFQREALELQNAQEDGDDDYDPEDPEYHGPPEGGEDE